jgi:hypothetical protein
MEQSASAAVEGNGAERRADPAVSRCPPAGWAGLGWAPTIFSGPTAE